MLLVIYYGGVNQTARWFNPMFHHIDHGEKPWRQKRKRPSPHWGRFHYHLRKNDFSDKITKHLEILGI
jgi:hypothetical protein